MAPLPIGRHLDGRGDRAADRGDATGAGVGAGAGAPGLARRRRAGQPRGQLAVAAAAARPPAGGARAVFEGSPLARGAGAGAPDNLASLRGFLRRATPAAVTAELLCRISEDGPGVDRAAIAAIAVPTLVIGNGAGRGASAGAGAGAAPPRSRARVSSRSRRSRTTASGYADEFRAAIGRLSGGDCAMTPSPDWLEALPARPAAGGDVAVVGRSRPDGRRDRAVGALRRPLPPRRRRRALLAGPSALSRPRADDPQADGAAAARAPDGRRTRSCSPRSAPFAEAGADASASMPRTARLDAALALIAELGAGAGRGAAARRRRSRRWPAARSDRLADAARDPRSA